MLLGTSSSFAAGYCFGEAIGACLGITGRKPEAAHGASIPLALYACSVTNKITPTIHFLPIFTVGALAAILYDYLQQEPEGRMEL
ncbi:MAG: hypothetical protein ACHP6I_02290 [Rickettsiales bacterium]